MKFQIENSYVQLSIDDSEDNTLVVDIVWVEELNRGQGIGTQLMRLAIDHAKKNDKKLSLYAEPQDDTVEEDRLIEWYRDLGFESDGDCDNLMTY
jgi:ribosomal protein S18 acetylase RimI-like enzyme